MNCCGIAVESPYILIQAVVTDPIDSWYIRLATYSPTEVDKQLNDDSPNNS